MQSAILLREHAEARDYNSPLRRGSKAQDRMAFRIAAASRMRACFVSEALPLIIVVVDERCLRNTLAALAVRRAVRCRPGDAGLAGLALDNRLETVPLCLARARRLLPAVAPVAEVAVGAIGTANY